MICKNCGTELEEGVAFCSNCGAQVPAPQPEPIPEPVEVAEAAPVQQEVVDPGKTLGTVSMILGIAGLVLSLVTFCCGYAGAVSSPLCIVGLILSIVAKKKSASAGFNNGAANIALILSILGLVAGVVISIISLVFNLGVMGISSMADMPMYG